MKPITIITICVICAATLISGCMETTTTTEYGEVTYNPITACTVIDVDCYEDGVHFTGTEVYDGEELVSGNGNVDGYAEGVRMTGTWSIDNNGEMSMNCNVDGYIEGCHVTGTMSGTVGGDACYDWHMKVDKYCAQGYHNTGYRTYKGCGDDIEWYSVLTATKDGYKTQYLNGYDDAEWRT